MKHRVYPTWRPAYEVVAVAVWLAAAGLYLLLGALGEGRIGMMFAGLIGWCLLAAVVRLGQAFALWEKKAKLTQQADLQFSTQDLFKRIAKAEKRARKGRLKIRK